MKRKFLIGGVSLMATFIAGGFAACVEGWIFDKILPMTAALVDGKEPEEDEESDEEEDEES